MRVRECWWYSFNGFPLLRDGKWRQNAGTELTGVKIPKVSQEDLRANAHADKIEDADVSRESFPAKPL